MPIQFESETGLDLGQFPEPVKQETGPGFGDAFSAAMRRENSIGSAVAQGFDQVAADEYFGRDDARNQQPKDLPPDYNPYLAALDNGYNEDELDALIRSGSQSQQDFEDFDFSLRRQRQDRETLDHSGMNGILAQMAAGLLDPTILMEGQAAIKAAKGIKMAARLVNTGKTAKGLALGATSLAGASMAGAEAMALQESALQPSQTGRTREESAMNIAAGAVIAPVLIGGPTAVAHLFGGRIGRYSDILKARGMDMETLGNKFADDVNDDSILSAMEKNMDDVMNDGKANDLSASAVDIPDIEADSLKGAFGFEKITKNFSPVLRTLQSPSRKVREMSQNLFENSMLMNKVTGGRYAQQIAVERMIKDVTRDAEGTIAGLRDAYKKYLKNNTQNVGQRVSGALGRDANVWTFDQFKQEVTKAMRRNDKHTQAEVQEIAQQTRKFYNKILERGKSAGVFPEWMTHESTLTADTFVNRIYNVDKIKRQEGAWRTTIRPHIEKAVRASVNEFYQVHKAKLDRVDGQAARLEFDNAKMRDAIKNQSGKGAGVDVMKIERMADIDVAEAQKRLAALTDEEFIKTRNLQDVDPDAVAMSRYAEVLRDYPDPDLAPDELKSIVEQYNLQALFNDVQFVLQKKPKRPDSLVDYLQKRGGLQDKGGELKVMGIDNKARPGFINNRTFSQTGGRKRGLQLDEATTLAVDEGFLPEGSNVQDLLDALDNHFRNGEPDFRPDDMETVNLLQQIEDTQEVLTQFGVDNPRQFIRDVYDAAKAARKGARADLKAAKERQKLSKDMAEQVRGDLKEKVIPRLSELYDYRKYFKRKMETQIRRNDKRLEVLRERAARYDSDFNARLKGQYDLDNDFADYIDEVVQNVTDKITKRGAPRLPDFIVMAERGPLKGRTFTIADETIEGFLNNDLEHLISSYTRSAGADVELAHKFGTLDVEEALTEVKTEYGDLRNKIINDSKLKPDERETKLKNLDSYMERDLRDLRAGWDIMRGTYARNLDDPDNYWVRGVQAARTVNYMRLLGGVVLSSLTDIAMPIFVHGMRRYYGQYLPSLITNLKGIKLQVKDAKFLRLAMEHEHASVMSALAEFGDPHAKSTQLERFITNSGRQFGKLSGIVYWNNLGQKVASSLSQTRILKAIETNSDLEYLRFLGIDKAMQDRIAKQYKDTRGIFGSYESDGVKIAGVERWTDDEAVRVYRAALGKDVDRQIIQPGRGDLPLFMNTEIGKTITQFKSFSAAAHSKLMIAGLQRRDSAAISGFAHLITLGMMVNYLKALESGRELSDKPAEWILDGVDRAGVMPLVFEVANTADKMNIGPRSLTGLQESSRYASRSAVDTLLGPTAGLLSDTAQTIGALGGSSPLSSSDVHKARRLLWGNNITYIRPFFDALEDAYGPSQ